MYILVVEEAPCGTAFAITPFHILTAYHNLYDETQGITYSTAAITKSVSKLGERFSIDSPIAVKLTSHDAFFDWAVLEVIDRSQPLPETLALVNEADLDEEKSMEVVALHAPVRLFLNSEMTELRIRKSDPPSRVQQFGKHGMTVICNGGLHAGSSGCPYVLYPGGRVLAMHLGCLDAYLETSRKKLKLQDGAGLSEVRAFACCIYCNN